MSPPIVDVTASFRAVDWTLRGRDFRDALPDDVRSMTTAIYALLSTNGSDLPIYDKNGRGKIIVPARASALKSGKLQGGLAARMLQNYDHFHRRPSLWKRENGVFPEVFRWLVVVDMSRTPSALDPRLLRHFETGWNRHVRSFLGQRGLSDRTQNGRSESRWLVGVPPTPEELRDELARYAGARRDLRRTDSAGRELPQ
jgi:hypothetical protein